MHNILCNTKVHFVVHKSRSLDPNLSQLKPICTRTFQFAMVYVVTVLILISFKWNLKF